MKSFQSEVALTMPVLFKDKCAITNSRSIHATVLCTANDTWPRLPVDILHKGRDLCSQCWWYKSEGVTKPHTKEG